MPQDRHWHRHSQGMSSIGAITRIDRFPVKSLSGERLQSVAVDSRGLRGDRLWAVRDADGKFGSGKNTRRFRRMPGLLDLAARYDAELVPIVRFPDGRTLRGGDAELDDALTAHVGRPVSLAHEDGISHFDEGPLHLVTSTSLARLAEHVGDPVDPAHLRANLLIDTGTAAARYDEADWIGCTFALGAVTVRAVRAMTRCVMLDTAQVGVAGDGRLLKAVTEANDATLGLVVEVVAGGTIHLGDRVTKLSSP